MSEFVGAALRLDHLVLIASDVEATLRFYQEVLGAVIVDLELWRSGAADYPVLHFGDWKINVHPLTSSLHPVARNPLAGTLDICFGFNGSPAVAAAQLKSREVPVVFGPTRQQGAQGFGTSLYFRDPDGNLLELVCYEDNPNQFA